MDNKTTKEYLEKWLETKEDKKERGVDIFRKRTQ